jgi:deoxyinosine 3'endonuclease (endonuclease V)
LTFNFTDEPLKCIGGVDISADKHNPNRAFASLVIQSFPDFENLHVEVEEVTLDYPYVPGFLAFREVPHLKRLIDKSPIKPQVVLVDGNGIFHNRGFGLASHLGVITGIPTIGCGKTVFAVDGITVNSVKGLSSMLHQAGDKIFLTGNSGKVWGCALRATDDSINPIIISIGHKISLESAVKIVSESCIYRVPEPIRQADKLSRKPLGS